MAFESLDETHQTAPVMLTEPYVYRMRQYDEVLQYHWDSLILGISLLRMLLLVVTVLHLRCSDLLIPHI